MTQTNFRQGTMLHEQQVRDQLKIHTLKFVTDIIEDYFTPTTDEEDECDKLILQTAETLQNHIVGMAQIIAQVIAHDLRIKTEFVKDY